MGLEVASLPLEVTVPEAVAALRRQIGVSVFICILGPSAPLPSDPAKLDLPVLVKALAGALADATFRNGHRACFLTTGLSGIQEIFARECGDDSKVINLVPQGHRSGYDLFGSSRDIHVGVTGDQRDAVFREIGDIYVAVEGGLDVTNHIRHAGTRGAIIVPVGCGAASHIPGESDMPAWSLVRPFFVSSDLWAILELARDSEERADQAGGALVAVVGDYLRLRKPDGVDGSTTLATTTAAAEPQRFHQGADSNANLEMWAASFYRQRAKAWPLRTGYAADLSGVRHLDMWSPGADSWRRNPDLKQHRCN